MSFLKWLFVLLLCKMQTITALAERFGGNSVVEAGEKMEELRKSVSYSTSLEESG